MNELQCQRWRDSAQSIHLRGYSVLPSLDEVHTAVSVHQPWSIQSRAKGSFHFNAAPGEFFKNQRVEVL